MSVNNNFFIRFGLIYFFINQTLFSLNANNIPIRVECDQNNVCKCSTIENSDSFDASYILGRIENGIIKDTTLIACSYHQIALHYYDNFEYFNSISYNEEAEFLRFRKVDGLLWRTYLNLGFNYIGLNDYKKAVLYLKKSLSEKGEKDSEDSITIYSNIGECYLELGDLETAKIFAEKSIKINANGEDINSARNALALILFNNKNYVNSLKESEKVLHSSQLVNDKFILRRALNNLARNYEELKDFAKALKYNSEVIDLMKDDTHDKATLLNNRGTILMGQNRHKESIKTIRQSLNLYTIYFNEDFNYEYSACFENLADNYTALQQFDTALYHYQKALHHLTNNFRTENIYQNPNPKDSTLFIYSNPDIIRVLHLKATAAYKYYQQNNNQKYLTLANQTYQTAFNFHDKLQKDISTENSRLFQAKNIVPYIENALNIAYEQQENGQDISKAAFRFMEKNKATVLLQSMNEADALQFANLPDSLVEKEKELKLYITEFTRQLNDAIEDEDSLEKMRLEKKLFDEKELYRQLINNLENNHPEYYNLKYQQNQTQLSNVQKQVNNQTAILSYFMGDSSIYTLLIQKESTQLFKTKKPAEWNAVIKDFRDAATLSNPEMKAYPYTKKIYNQFVNNAHTLYAWLLKEPLEELDHITHLKIIPDAALNYIPFELLLSEVNDFETINYKNLAYLLKQHSVSYHYSAALMMEQDEKNKTNQLKNKTSYGGYAASYAVEDTIDNDLPKIRQLVSEAASFFKGEAHLGNAATKQNFLKDSSSYQILHFGMHGKLDDQSPLNSHLVFTKDSMPEHSNLYAADLYNIKLQTDLAVLSACNTGSGVLKKGEGVMSLSRAFTYAGCPSLVMSLWSIPESASAKVLNTFFENIKKGDSKDIALQQAKLAYLDNALTTECHPINWAGLVATGNSEALHFKKGSYRLSVVLLLLLGGLFISIRLFTNSIT